MSANFMTDWFPASIKPVRKGCYEVRNSVDLHWNAKGKLKGPKIRFWDGSNWLTVEHQDISIFGKHETHQWRGITKAQHELHVLAGINKG